MSIWIREDGTITDKDDPTAFEYVEAAQRDQLREALGEALMVINHADVRTGHCCCGSPVDSHTMGDGHSPVDDGEYHADSVVEQARAALKATEEG